MTADDEAVLYIVNASYLPDIQFTDKVAAIIIEDTELEDSAIPGGIGNALCVSEKTDVPEGLIQLKSKFQNQFKIGYMLSLLQTAIVENTGMQNIMKIIAKFFKRPVSLLDTTFRFICKSRTYKPDYEKSLFPENHDKDGFDKPLLEFMRKEGFLNKLVDAADPIHYETGSCFQIC